MGHSAPNPSDNTIIPPSSLAERLKKVAADGEPLGLAQAGEVSIKGPDLGLRVSNTLLAVLIPHFSGSICDHRSLALARCNKNAFVD